MIRDKLSPLISKEIQPVYGIYATMGIISRFSPNFIEITFGAIAILLFVIALANEWRKKEVIIDDALLEP